MGKFQRQTHEESSDKPQEKVRLTEFSAEGKIWRIGQQVKIIDSIKAINSGVGEIVGFNPDSASSILVKFGPGPQSPTRCLPRELESR